MENNSVLAICPIICTDISSQCYFVHLHLQQHLIQSNSVANRVPHLSIIASNDPQQNLIQLLVTLTLSVHCEHLTSNYLEIWILLLPY